MQLLIFLLILLSAEFDAYRTSPHLPSSWKKSLTSSILSGIMLVSPIPLTVNPSSPFNQIVFAPIQTSSASAAFSFFQSNEQNKIDELCKFQKPVAELLDDLRPTERPNAVGVYAVTQTLKGGKEDSDVVLTNQETYLKPLLKKMEELSKLVKLDDAEKQKRLELLPLLMKGHILELTEAINSQKSTNQAKEVEEVFETLAEYLKLVGDKYTITPYTPTRPLTDAELFGPFGCEFYGKQRVKDSNACVEKK